MAQASTIRVLLPDPTFFILVLVSDRFRSTESTSYAHQQWSHSSPFVVLAVCFPLARIGFAVKILHSEDAPWETNRFHIEVFANKPTPEPFVRIVTHSGRRSSAGNFSNSVYTSTTFRVFTSCHTTFAAFGAACLTMAPKLIRSGERPSSRISFSSDSASSHSPPRPHAWMAELYEISFGCRGQAICEKTRSTC